MKRPKINEKRGQGWPIQKPKFGKNTFASPLFQMKSIEETPVVFALFEDLFPVITMDFNDEFVAALEWIGTFDRVDAGNVSLFKYVKLVT